MTLIKIISVAGIIENGISYSAKIIFNMEDYIGSYVKFLNEALH